MHMPTEYFSHKLVNGGLSIISNINDKIDIAQNRISSKLPVDKTNTISFNLAIFYFEENNISMLKN